MASISERGAVAGVEHDKENMCTARGHFFTEQELQETIQDMGYDILPCDLSAFRNELERFIDEEEEANRSNDGRNNSFFASLPLSMEDNAPVLTDGFAARHEVARGNSAKSRNSSNAIFEQPCSSADLRLPSSHRGGLNHSALSHEETLDRDVVSDLIYESYVRLQKMHAENEHLAALTREIEELRNSYKQHLRPERGQAFFPRPSYPSDGEAEGVVGNSRLTAQNEDSTLIAQDDENTLIADDDDAVRKRQDFAKQAIRPVLCPRPGGLPFRHDPVKMFELYRREWTNNPTPGEKKRLSLRWRIREFMLKRDIPSADYNRLQQHRALNPEWIP